MTEISEPKIQRTDLPPSPKCRKLPQVMAVAIGIILILGGIASIGLNTISHWDGLWQIGGYSSLGVGALVALIAGIRHGIQKRRDNHSVTTTQGGGVAAYSLESVIDSIHKARNEEFRIALFMGRTNDQPLPTEDGVVWFSLDYDLKEQAPTHHHLKIDFNDVEAMKKINTMFDTIVVDYSVLQFFTRSPWDALYSLARRNGSSKIFVESTRHFYEISKDLLFVDGKSAILRIPMQDAKNPEAEKRHFGTLKSAIMAYLFSINFKTVELKNGDFPYRPDLKNIEYWELSI